MLTWDPPSTLHKYSMTNLGKASTNNAKSRRNSTGGIPSEEEGVRIMQMAKDYEAKQKAMVANKAASQASNASQAK